MRKTLSARVFPGVPEVFAIRRPTSAFRRLDLPTLERPTNATSGSGGSSSTSARGNEPMKEGRSMLRPYLSFFFLARTLSNQQRRAAGRDAFGGDRHLAHVIAARQLEHDLGHHLFENGAQPSRAGAALHGLRRDRLEGILLERQADVLEVEQLLILLGERVLGLGEDPDQRVFIESVERYGDRQTADELGYEPVAQQVVRLDVHEWVFLQLLGDAFGDFLFCEADLPAAGARFDDLLEPVERAATDEEDVLGVDLDVFLLRVLAAALRRNAGDRAFQNLEQRLLHAFTRDVPGDARVLGLARDLVDFVDVDDAALCLGDVEVGRLQQPYQDVLDILADVAGFGEGGGVRNGERHVEDARQRLGQQRLADAGRADQEDVALVELDLVIAARVGVDAFVVIVDVDGEGLLGAVLPDHILVQHILDFGGRGDLRDGFGDFALFVLRQNLIAERDALVANVDRRPGDEFPD